MNESLYYLLFYIIFRVFNIGVKSKKISVFEYNLKRSLSSSLFSARQIFSNIIAIIGIIVFSEFISNGLNGNLINYNLICSASFFYFFLSLKERKLTSLLQYRSIIINKILLCFYILFVHNLRDLKLLILSSGLSLILLIYEKIKIDELKNKDIGELYIFLQVLLISQYYPNRVFITTLMLSIFIPLFFLLRKYSTAKSEQKVSLLNPVYLILGGLLLLYV
jgi:hypothetical protein